MMFRTHKPLLLTFLLLAFNFAQDDCDGQGAYIKEWNVAEAQPTDAQLDALEAEATTLENNNQVIETRKGLYGTLEQQIENIMENGLQSEIDRVNQIKTEHPKS